MQSFHAGFGIYGMPLGNVADAGIAAGRSFAEHGQRPCLRLGQAQQKPKQRCLAGSVRAKHRDKLPLFYGKFGILPNCPIAIAGR